MDLYLLEYLVAFRDCGTVDRAASKLSVTAPTVSRGLKKLEGELGVALLDRTPVKISLNATGLFAAERAEDLLSRAEDFRESVAEFDADHVVLRVASEVPGALRLLSGYPHPIMPHDGFVDDEEAIRLLLGHQADLVVATSELTEDGVESVFIGRDTLIVKLTHINPLYDRDSLSFADLDGHEFVLPRAIGAWKDVIEKNAQGAMLIYQQSVAAFEELVRYSNFPIFRTLLTNSSADSGFHERRPIPIADEEATLELYASYRVEDRGRLAEAIRCLSERMESAKTLA